MKHIAKEHPDSGLKGGRTHAHRHESRVTDHTKESYGQRIDMHPWTTARLATGEIPERWFFSIEGTLKNDAMVRVGEFAFNVPSVTMWPADELEDFALRHLAGIPTFVVPDSDWADNPKVATQAFLAVDALRRMGVPAVVAAPSPEPRRCKLHEAPAGSKRGVDDYRADGGDLDDMRVIFRADSPAFRRWAGSIKVDRRFGEIRARKRLVDVVRWAATHADEHGRVVKPSDKMARHLDVSVDRIEATLDTFAMLEELAERYDDLPEPPFTSEIVEGPDWERHYGGRPFRITEIAVREDLRADQNDAYTVGTWESPAPR